MLVKKMLEVILDSLIPMVIIFGTPVGVLIGVRMEKLLFGDRLDKIGEMMGVLRICGYALLWWWFCVWLFVDVLGSSV